MTIVVNKPSIQTLFSATLLYLYELQLANLYMLFPSRSLKLDKFKV